MTSRDSIEFYHGDKIIAGTASSMVPSEGSMISIRGKTWKINRVTFALDHADETQERGMRCNVFISPA